MMKPTLSLERMPNRAIRIVVRNATPELCDLLDTLRILPVDDIANTREIICTTAAEIDAAREPLRSLFDARGQWKEKV